MLRKAIRKVVTVGTACLAMGMAVQTHAGNEFESVTRLSGAQSSPVPVESGARGTARIEFEQDFSSASIITRFAALAGDVTKVHLHCNRAGANGPLAVILYDGADPDLGADGVVGDGARFEGTLYNIDVIGGPACAETVGQPINNLVSLAAAIDARLVYWNVHTTAFPGGELRGQVRPLDAPED